MPTSDKPALILVVDDQSANIQLIGQVLDHSGYQVMPAMSGEQALARARVRKPDLVLLDMIMPGMNGVQTARELAQTPGLGDVPILFVTAANDRESLLTAFSAGAVDYITKPFVVEELLARVRTHLDLKAARDRMAQMLQDREDVVRVVAHDLKNPLTCVLFSVQMLAQRAFDSGDRELIEEINTCTEEALRYIQRFLSRGAEGQRLRQFLAQTLPLAAIADEAVRLQRAAAAAHNISVQRAGEAVAQADPAATRNVMQNLISNAIRHSPADSLVEVELGPSRPGFVACRIMDRGPGVSPEIVDRLFENYVRVATGDPRSSQWSSGLGLAIAKHDVAQMGGHLWYSPRAGGGSVFAFELPQAATNGNGNCHAAPAPEPPVGSVSG